MHRFVLQPHIVYIVALCLFGVLLYLEGWVWPLKAVAAMLPVAAYLVFA